MRLCNVSYAWPDGAAVFRNLSIEIPCDSLTLLTGPNGSGKTTLCRLLAGLMRPQQGRIETGDCKVSYLKQEVEANLVALTPALDVGVWLHRFMRRETENDFRACAVALERVGLMQQAGQPVWELSGGQMRRTALAGLMLRPNVFWLLDEPESALDDEGFDTLLDMLAKRTGGTLVVTHKPQKYAALPHNHIQLTNIEEPCDN